MSHSLHDSEPESGRAHHRLTLEPRVVYEAQDRIKEPYSKGYYEKVEAQDHKRNGGKPYEHIRWSQKLLMLTRRAAGSLLHGEHCKNDRSESGLREQ